MTKFYPNLKRIVTVRFNSTADLSSTKSQIDKLAAASGGKECDNEDLCEKYDVSYAFPASVIASGFGVGLHECHSANVFENEVKSLGKQVIHPHFQQANEFKLKIKIAFKDRKIVKGLISEYGGFLDSETSNSMDEWFQSASFPSKDAIEAYVSTLKNSNIQLEIKNA